MALKVQAAIAVKLYALGFEQNPLQFVVARL
jgi:hypothetical protein